jgi:hypothetical protein
MNGTENEYIYIYIYMPRCDDNLGNLLDGRTMGDKKGRQYLFW